MKQDCGIGGRNDLHLLQHLLESCTVADDALEAGLRADFRSQIELIGFRLTHIGRTCYCEALRIYQSNGSHNLLPYLLQFSALRTFGHERD
jgi:hypothetical protein